MRAFMALLVAAVAWPAFAAEADFVAAAEKEGQVVVFGDLNAVPALAAGFQAKYPKVKVVTTAGDAWQLLTRFMNERAAGRAVLDVFFLAEDVVTTADNAGALAKFSPDAIKGFPPASLPSKNGTFALGNIGVMMIVGTYLALQLERIRSTSLTYSVLNAVGAALIAVSLLVDFNLSAFLIEVFWVAISLIGIQRWWRARHPA